MYQLLLLPYFVRQLKPLLKKHPGLRESLIADLNEFDPRYGTPLGKRLYKIRVKSPDLPRGKSSSFRLILQWVEESKFIVPVAIYFKGDTQNLSKKEILRHQNAILAELSDPGH